MIDFTQFATDLGVYGTVSYCGYNGDDQTKIIIKMEGVVATAVTLGSLNTIIHGYTGTSHPINEEILITSGYLTTVVSSI